MTYMFLCEDCGKSFEKIFNAKDDKSPLCDCGSDKVYRDFRGELSSKIIVVEDDTSGFNISAGVRYSSRSDLKRKVYERGLEFIDGNGLAKKHTPLYADEMKKERNDRLSSINKAPEVVIE